MNLRRLLTDSLDECFATLGSDAPKSLVFATTNEEFGDYQANGAMAMAKQLGQQPRVVAQRVIDSHPLASLGAHLTVAGPGFINIRLDNGFLAKALSEDTQYQTVDKPERIVIDYSSPNIAKELHVGHLRSTVIGDALARLFELVGHTVIRQNHVGDWGTAFGKLIAFVDDLNEADRLSIEDIEQLYVAASEKFENDQEFAQSARQAVLKLQQHDVEVIKTWRRIVQASLDHVHSVYSRLDVSLQSSDVKGESTYGEDLPTIVIDLESAGLLTHSDGAKCVFVEGFKSKDGSPLPMIVQKSDGGYLYHTTDLAALKYRTQCLNADRVVYLTDSRQIHHFKLLFAVGKLVGYLPDNVRPEHLVFGSILGKSGEPFRTRSGGSVLLNDLIQEGIERALSIVKSKSPHLSTDEKKEIALRVAVGAIKYADLSKNRTNDYRFDWDVMLSLEGNTAPYLQYAHARICSLFARANVDIRVAGKQPIELLQQSERALALRVLRFSETLELCIEERKPHYLCNYLYDLTVHFMRFYECCPVLQATTRKIRESRLSLCAKTAQVLRIGLENLGIVCPPRM